MPKKKTTTPDAGRLEPSEAVQDAYNYTAQLQNMVNGLEKILTEADFTKDEAKATSKQLVEIRIALRNTIKNHKKRFHAKNKSNTD
jgi:hypothetical protein